MGAVTTSIREHAALNELMHFRLCDRLITGGTEKATHGDAAKILKNVPLHKLKAQWQEIESLLQHVQEQIPPQEEDLQKVKSGIMKFCEVRVSQTLLLQSGLGRRLTELKKSHILEPIRTACRSVTKHWKMQVKQEQECYKGSVTEPVIDSLPPASSQEADESPNPLRTGGGNRQQMLSPGEATGADGHIHSLASGSRRGRARHMFTCPIHMPEQLFRSLRATFNPPQFHAILQACRINSRATEKEASEVTLLQG